MQANVKGGEKALAHLEKINKALTSKKTVKVGFLQGSTYPDGTSLPMVAATQNYGAPSRGIPPRPFFSNMIKLKSPTWPDAMANLLKKNDYDADKTLNQTGLAIKGQLQQSIRDTNLPPLKPATIARKGFSKPLIDTSHMINSVDYEVS